MTDMRHRARTGRPRTIPRLRHNRDYRWLWIGQAVSLLGDEVLTTAIMLWLGLTAGGQSWGPAATAGVLIARVVPILLLSSLGGVYADRLDRRRTMLVTDAIRGCLVLALAVLLLAAPNLPLAGRLGAVYTVIALCSVATQFFNPCRYGLLATVVADADRERMGSITAGTTALAGILGPALAAGMLVLANVQWSLLITAAGFAVSFAAVAKIRAPRPPGAATRGGRDSRPHGIWRELRAGVKFFAGNDVLRIMLITNALVMMAVSAIHTLDIFFVMRNLHAPAQLYGWLGTVFGIGSVLGAVLAAAFANRLAAKKVYAYGFALTGLLLAVYSRMTTPLGALIALFLAGVTIAAVNSMIGPLIMRSTPEDLIGRMSGMFQQFMQLASLLSVIMSAWLAGTVLRDLDATVAGVHFGTIDTIFLAAGLLMVVAGTWAARALRERKDT